MADNLLKKQLECMRMSYGGVLIECYPDGTVQVFADPERYQIMMKAGRGEGRDTTRLHSCVVISPFFATHTGMISQPQAMPPPPAVGAHNPLSPTPERAAAPTHLDRNDPRIRDLGGPE